MSKILIDKSVLLDRIAELEKQFKGKVGYNMALGEIKSLQSILQQGEEYNENEAIEFGNWLKNNYCPGNNVDTPENIYWCESNNPMNNRELTTQELYKLYKFELKRNAPLAAIRC